MPSVQENTPHPVATKRRGLVYVFTPKHHGASPNSSCWAADLSFDEEFAIFDRADGIIVEDRIAMDERQVADADGNLYGYEKLENGSLRELGTWHQQLTEFPHQTEGSEWHGYPIYPTSPLAPPRYQGQKCRPATEVFDRMVQIGDITPGQRKKLKKGECI